MDEIEKKLKRVGKSCFVDFFPFFLDENYNLDKEKKATDILELIQKQNPSYTKKSCETRAYTIKSLLEENIDTILNNIISSSKVDEDAKTKAQKHLGAYRLGNPMDSNLKVIIAKERNNENIYPDELTEIEHLSEGTKKSIIVNAYERNPKARKKCIEHYGLNCAVCDFEFEDKYGDIGRGFIHVHHLTQLSDIEQEYKVNPIEDLRPVCPNCHAMLHKKNPPYTIEELKQKIQDNSNTS